jgi:hypothetical protein
VGPKRSTTKPQKTPVGAGSSSTSENTIELTLLMPTDRPTTKKPARTEKPPLHAKRAAANRPGMPRGYLLTEARLYTKPASNPCRRPVHSFLRQNCPKKGVDWEIFLPSRQLGISRAARDFPPPPGGNLSARSELPGRKGQIGKSGWAGKRVRSEQSGQDALLR